METPRERRQFEFALSVHLSPQRALVSYISYLRAQFVLIKIVVVVIMDDVIAPDCDFST